MSDCLIHPAQAEGSFGLAVQFLASAHLQPIVVVVDQEVEQGRAAEGSPVRLAQPMLPDGGQVLGGGVALVPGVAVPRIFLIHRHHQAIPGHLGHDRGGRDAGASLIALHEALMGHREAGDGKAVRKHVIGGRVQSQHRVQHGGQGGPVDVEGVDVGNRARDDAPGHRAVHDPVVQAGAGVGGEELGVAQAGNGPVGVEDDGSRRDGTGKTAAPDLVDTGHTHVTGAPEGVLDVAASGRPQARRARCHRGRSRRPRTMAAVNAGMLDAGMSSAPGLDISAFGIAALLQFGRVGDDAATPGRA